MDKESGIWGILEEIESVEVDSEKRELKNICEELMREADKLDGEAEAADSIEMIELLAKAEGIRIAVAKITENILGK